MAVPLVVLLLLVVSAAIFIWWLLLLIEAVRMPASVSQGAGQNQILHIVLMVALGALGTLVNVLTARPQLRPSAQLRG